MFKSRHSHQSIQTRTFYQSVKRSGLLFISMRQNFDLIAIMQRNQVIRFSGNLVLFYIKRKVDTIM